MAHKPPPKNQPGKGNNRDAKTGQYVTEQYAKKHPDKTIKETYKKDNKPN